MRMMLVYFINTYIFWLGTPDIGLAMPEAWEDPPALMKEL